MRRIINSILGFLILFVLLSACKQKLEKPLFSEEKTSRIMADLMLAEAATFGYKGYTQDSLTHAYYDQVFEIHDLTKEEYEKNLQILAQDENRIARVIEGAIHLIKPDTSAVKKDAETELSE